MMNKINEQMNLKEFYHLDIPRKPTKFSAWHHHHKWIHPKPEAWWLTRMQQSLGPSCYELYSEKISKNHGSRQRNLRDINAHENDSNLIKTVEQINWGMVLSPHYLKQYYIVGQIWNIVMGTSHWLILNNWSRFPCQNPWYVYLQNLDDNK